MSTLPTLRWIAFADQQPPSSAALDNPSIQTTDVVLVTNNLAARDRMGRMTNVWLAAPFQGSEGWEAYNEADLLIIGLSHWCHPLAALDAPCAAPAPQAVPAEPVLVDLLMDGEEADEIERAAELLESYVQFIQNHVMDAEIDQHPYLPEIEQSARELRALVARIGEFKPTSDYQFGHADALEWAARQAEGNDPRTGEWLFDDPHELTKALRKRALDTPAAPAAPAADAVQQITWPAARDVGRIGDMSPTAHLRVGFDSDNDVFVSIWDESGGASVEFCNGGGGGGQSMRTRLALIALMVAIEADNAEKPSRDWWALRAAQAQGGA